jgi:hypothetical protein
MDYLHLWYSETIAILSGFYMMELDNGNVGYFTCDTLSEDNPYSCSENLNTYYVGKALYGTPVIGAFSCVSDIIHKRLSFLPTKNLSTPVKLYGWYHPLDNCLAKIWKTKKNRTAYVSSFTTSGENPYIQSDSGIFIGELDKSVEINPYEMRYWDKNDIDLWDSDDLESRSYNDSCYDAKYPYFDIKYQGIILPQKLYPFMTGNNFIVKEFELNGNKFQLAGNVYLSNSLDWRWKLSSPGLINYRYRKGFNYSQEAMADLKCMVDNIVSGQESNFNPSLEEMRKKLMAIRYA